MPLQCAAFSIGGLCWRTLFPKECAHSRGHDHHPAHRDLLKTENCLGSLVGTTRSESSELNDWTFPEDHYTNVLTTGCRLKSSVKQWLLGIQWWAKNSDDCGTMTS